MKLVHAAVLFLFCSVLAQAVLASSLSCNKTYLKDPSAIIDTLRSLQTSDQPIFANQSLFQENIREGGGGACATSTGFNAIQILRVMEGLSASLDPKIEVDSIYNEYPDLRDGRVTNNQFLTMLDLWKKKFSHPEYEWIVDFDQFLTSPIRKKQPLLGQVRQRKNLSTQLLTVQPDQLKFLLYKVYDGERKFLGRHFVILSESVSDGMISTLDPNKPSAKYRFHLIRSSLPTRSHPSTVELVSMRPNSLGWRNFLETVVTVNLVKR